MESVRRREPLAFHSVNETDEPEQLRISVEKREDSGLSWVRINCCSSFRVGGGRGKCRSERAYDLSAVDSNYEVVPGFDGYIAVLVSKYLETGRGLFIPRRGLRGAFRVEARDEAIEGAEHGRHDRWNVEPVQSRIWMFCIVFLRNVVVHALGGRNCPIRNM